MSVTRSLAHLGAAALLAAACSNMDSATPDIGAGGMGDVLPPPVDSHIPQLSGEAPCPGYEPPAIGSLCSQRMAARWDFTCEYGHDLDRKCNDVYECAAGIWKQLPRPTCFGRCPDTHAEIVPGTPCADVSIGCSYLEGTCACVPEGDAGLDDADAGPDAASGPGIWRCATPPEDGCPPQRPGLGSNCVRAMTCDYGACALARDVVYSCIPSEGRWVQSDFPECE